MLDLPPIAIVVLVLLTLASLQSTVSAFRNRRWSSLTWKLPVATSFVLLGLLLATLSLASRGYRALTREDLAATVHIERTAGQRFKARFERAGESSVQYEFSGDALSVDAHIIKFHPWFNILGLHTAYELDRVSGRFDDIEDAKTKERTVFSLASNKPVDIVDVLRKGPKLKPFVDARYGSGSFVPAKDGQTLELMVSTTGLLFRDKADNR